MIRIGEFSKLSKTTIKALRYYESEGLLLPCFVDRDTNYRYYDTSQLLDLSRIITLRQIGCSISEIKGYFENRDLSKFLQAKKLELEKNILEIQEKLQRINYLLKEKIMKREVVKKELPKFDVYYKEGVFNSFADIPQFILESAKECLKTNPNIKCIQPDYCFMSYLDGEFKESNFRGKYSQAVEKKGKENDTIKFETLPAITAMCIYHKGSYDSLHDTYSYIIKWVEDNGYKIIAPIRERYIDGVWNKESANDYLTEIQVPVEKA